MIKYACSETLKSLPPPKLTYHSRFGANMRAGQKVTGSGSCILSLRFVRGDACASATISPPVLPFSTLTSHDVTTNRGKRFEDGGRAEKNRICQRSGHSKPEVPNHLSLPLSLTLQRAREERKTERRKGQTNNSSFSCPN